MRRMEPPAEEPRKQAPAYITTFSDMVTLLLTFFVLLLSLGKMQDPELIAIGRESFIRALATFGLKGILQASANSPDLEHMKVIYHPEQSVEGQGRSLDVRERQTEELYQELIDSAEVIPSRVVGSTVTYEPADIRFAPESSELSEEARAWLAASIASRRSVLLERDVKIYVVGIAASEKWERQQWELSAKRAEAVAEYLRGQIPQNLGWSVFAWGAGDGGEWTGRAGLADKSTEILIALLRNHE